MQDKSKEVSEMLKYVFEFYRPEHPELKEGVGHEGEHIAGVIKRSNDILNLIMSDKKQYQNVNIDNSMMTSVAALHDIGNTIDRDDHGHLGCGVIRGCLMPTDVLNVPFKTKEGYLNPLETKNIKKCLLGDADYQSLTDKEKDGIEDVMVCCLKFNIGYHGFGTQKESDPYHIKNTEKAVERTLIKSCPDLLGTELHEFLVDFAKRNNMMEKTKYNPELKNITAKIRDTFSRSEINTIAQAVQDHNIDFNADGSRYKARSIYGMVVADADKDNVVGTFALRTYAFSYNKWPNKAPEYFRTADGDVDTHKCALHIYDQAWERFRMPHSYGSEEEKRQQIPENILHYKTLGKIKGIVCGEENIHAFLKEHPEATVKYIPDGTKTEPSGTPYIIIQEKGDDVYSQIDKEYGSDNVMQMREGFLQDIQYYANAAENPEMEAKVPDEMQLFMVEMAFDMAPSIEEAVALYEGGYYGMEWTPDNVIDEALGLTELPGSDMHSVEDLEQSPETEEVGLIIQGQDDISL